MFEKLHIGRVREVGLEECNALLAERMEWISPHGPQVTPRHHLMSTVVAPDGSRAYVVAEWFKIPVLEPMDARVLQGGQASQEGSGRIRSGSAECQHPQPNELP